MENKNIFKNVNIKNCTYDLFNDAIEVDEDISVDRILLDEISPKIFQFIRFYTKKSMHAKPLRIRFNKADRITKIYNGIKYLKLSNSYHKFYYRIYNVILIGLIIL